MNQPMNRQTKRLMKRQGADKPGEKRARPQPGADPKRERVGLRAFFGEVKAELKKVAWPSRKEVFNSTVVVLIAVTFMTALIFGFDYASSKFVLFLFD